MALKVSTGLRNALLNGTTGFKQIMGNGVMDIYSGSQPSNADAVENGVLLVRISLNSATCGSGGTGGGTGGTDGINFGTSVAGVIPKDGNTWSGNVIVSGTAGWFRFYDQNITQGANGTAVRMDGVCALLGGDLNLANLGMASTSVITIDSFEVTMPAY
ncbi:MAG: hypothetical protein LLG40_13345 [Deltaproteobacteria bacterium]|nr:hypothetical protein [Deltaproteobacteria bacterium]